MNIHTHTGILLKGTVFTVKLSEETSPSELLQKLASPLRRMVSLSVLEKVDITSLDKSQETWTRPQVTSLGAPSLFLDNYQCF